MSAILRLALLCAAFAAPAFAQQDETLPELGDSASQVLSPAQEAQIGRQYMRALFRDRSNVDDRELLDYLNQLGAEISAHASLRGGKIRVHLVQNSQLNAFALPGGHITFHTGLLLSADDEDELASVMAHEIAHVSQRHLPRMMAKAEASKVPAVAAIMASLLVGGKTGILGLTLSNAALISSQLAYSRDFEREADAVGIKLLAEAEYDPAAMARFFGKLDPHGGIGGAPEYLRTHPLSYTRIAAAENRAVDYPPPRERSQLAFYFAREKIRALYSPRDNEIIEFFTAQAEQAAADNDEEKKTAAHYGIALTHYKLRRYREARAALQPLLDAHPREIALHIARAEIDAADGMPAEAAARYAQLMEERPQLLFLTHYYASALLAAGDAAAAKRILRKQLRRHKEMFLLYPLLSKSNAQLGALAEAHQATAEYHIALGDFPAAVNALQLALRETGEEGYLHESLTARLKQLKDAMQRAR